MIFKPNFLPCIDFDTAISSIWPIVPPPRVNLRSRMIDPTATNYMPLVDSKYSVKGKGIHEPFLWVCELCRLWNMSWGMISYIRMFLLISHDFQHVCMYTRMWREGLPVKLDGDMVGATVRTDNRSNNPLEWSSLASGRSLFINSIPSGRLGGTYLEIGCEVGVTWCRNWSWVENVLEGGHDDEMWLISRSMMYRYDAVVL
jgi:hypothetical protein